MTSPSPKGWDASGQKENCPNLEALEHPCTPFLPYKTRFSDWSEFMYKHSEHSWFAYTKHIVISRMVIEFSHTIFWRCRQLIIFNLWKFINSILGEKVSYHVLTKCTKFRYFGLACLSQTPALSCTMYMPEHKFKWPSYDILIRRQEGRN